MIVLISYHDDDDDYYYLKIIYKAISVLIKYHEWFPTEWLHG